MADEECGRAGAVNNSVVLFPLRVLPCPSFWEGNVWEMCVAKGSEEAERAMADL
jgi:hypothetical protein